MKPTQEAPTPTQATRSGTSFTRMPFRTTRSPFNAKKKPTIAFEILLIENNPDDARLVKEAIAEAPNAVSIRIKNATTLEEALQLIEKEHFDVVLLDLLLPDSKGIDALLELKPYVLQFPVIILTGLHDETLALHALKMGAQDYMSKREMCGRTLFRILRHAMERHRLQLELKHAQQKHHKDQKLESLGMMANRVAHDFNNLLAGISGNADLLCLNAPGSAESIKYLQGIIHGCHQGSELCDQLLNYSGKGKRHDEVVDLNEMVEEIDSALGASFPREAIVHYQLHPSVIPVEIDSTQIRQVIMNFIKNAVDSLDRKAGRVKVSSGHLTVYSAYTKENYWGPPIKHDKRFVHLKIQDTGCGIAKEQIARIFDPFFTTKDKGKGLGLSSALGIVQAHGGAIKVESKLGSGTTFHLFLPETQKELTQRTCNPLQPTDWKPTGVAMIIDDNEKLLGILEDYFHRIGLETITATRGKEGLALFEKHHESISIVLLDSNMPEMNGEATYSAMSAIHPEIKTVFMSGFNRNDADCASIKNNPHATFLKKPFHLADLKNTIGGLMHK